MSRNQSNRRGPNSSEKKPFCKVCCDAGKSEKQYTSHFVKDRDGKVTCPTLLGQECRYCFRAGHTVKFCPVLKEREQEKEKYAKKCARADRERVVLEMVQAETRSLLKEKAPLCGGAFAALAADSDSDSDEGSPRLEQRKEKNLVEKMMSPAGIKYDEMTPSAQAFWGRLATQKDASAYEKGQAYFEKVDMGLTMEFPGAARFLRANGTSIGAVMLNTKYAKPKTQEEEFPALSSNVTLRPHQKSFAYGETSFAAKLFAAVTAPKPVMQPKKAAVVVPVVQRDAWSDDEDSVAEVAKIVSVMAAAPAPAPLKRILNWADAESSDDEDDEPYFSDGDSRRNR
jgi:protein nanos 1